MKTKTILFLITISSFFGCKKMLDKSPLDSLAPANYYNTEQELKTALNGVYNSLGKNYATTKLWLFNADADASYPNNGVATGVYMHNTSSSDFQIGNEWATLYEGINQANMLLANVDRNKDINIDVRNYIRGEALFLRAFFYFELAKTFGGVPLRLKPTMSPQDISFPRSSALEVYKQVERDMIEALPLVLSIKQTTHGGRVNKSAVRALLARVNLYMAGEPIKDNPMVRMNNVISWTKEIIEDTEFKHELNPSYAQVFINYAADLYDPKESIWEIEYWGNGIDTYQETGQVGATNGAASGNPNTGLATASLKVTGYLYDKFKNDDIRKYWCIPHFEYDGTAAAPLPNGAKKNYLTSSSFNAKMIWDRNGGKFRREYEVVSRNGYKTPQNFPLVRYSDVLLMYAEAANELDQPLDKAIEYLTAVRKRSWSTGIKSLKMIYSGSGYNSSNPPTVSLVGNGTQILTRPVISGGKLTSIDILFDGVNSHGKGYSIAPKVVISGGVGSGAQYETVLPDPNGAKVTDDEKSNKKLFREAIQDERLLELCFETQRKFDLIRWGIYNTRIEEVGRKFAAESLGHRYIKIYTNVTSRDVLWPIPINEMTLNTGIGNQNFGW